MTVKTDTTAHGADDEAPQAQPSNSLLAMGGGAEVAFALEYREADDALALLLTVVPEGHEARPLNMSVELPVRQVLSLLRREFIAKTAPAAAH